MSVGIIGTGLAGLRMAAELRERGFSGDIVAWDEENRAPYDRPALSKELFGAYIHPLDDDGLGNFAALEVRVIPARVRGIHPEKGGWGVEFDSVAMDGAATSLSAELYVDDLVIATGARPHATISGAHVLYSARDAEHLREAITGDSTVHIVGAGWIGTELASVSADKGASVYMWEATPHVIDRTFHGTVDEIWSEWLENAGVTLHLGEPYPGGDADVVVQATGARPSLDFLSPTTLGIELTPRGALLTDHEGRVIGAPAHLYAIGDCADVVLPDGEHRVGGHWTAVLGNAARAAAHLTSTESPRFLDTPEVFSTQFGHEIALVGEVPALDEPDIELVRGDTSGGLVLQWLRNGELVALLGVDAPREVSRARRALRRTLSEGE